MTGLTIRNRLAELVTDLPSYALYNVAAFTMSDTWALSPIMLPANPSNKQKLMDWMGPVNPLEGEYEHCFSIPQDARRAVVKPSQLGQHDSKRNSHFIQQNGRIHMRLKIVYVKNMLQMPPNIQLIKRVILTGRMEKHLRIGLELWMGIARAKTRYGIYFNN